ncbi:MAG: hydrogenase nickel incorporation protein HypB [Phycisphaerae bacterium]|nr:hydrogenase nickel incorporation protein HypB [Phycisphaerae bacterium]NUQ45646.1 hydrogenase nickel incorporation protein HypB [Phycisphaerae bacterium]
MRVDVLRNVFARNEAAAAENRRLLDQRRIVCINLLGGAGSGKTTLLEAVMPRLRGHMRVAVLEGDLATTRDADRIAALDVPVVQLLTDGGCHLNATLVQHGLARLPLDEIDLVVIENVGNPICPANFDLGEHARIAVLSVAEGSDKPSKYPLLFKEARLVVITKCDLLAMTDFDLDQAMRDIRRINPDALVIPTDARGGRGIEDVAQWLRSRCRVGADVECLNVMG